MKVHLDMIYVVQFYPASVDEKHCLNYHSRYVGGGGFPIELTYKVTKVSTPNQISVII